MGFQITAYRATRIKAVAVNRDGSSWVDVVIVETQRNGPPIESEMTVFFDCEDGARKATAYANAINVTDKEFHPAEVAAEREDA